MKFLSNFCIPCTRLTGKNMVVRPQFIGTLLLEFSKKMVCQLPHTLFAWECLILRCLVAADYSFACCLLLAYSDRHRSYVVFGSAGQSFWRLMATPSAVRVRRGHGVHNESVTVRGKWDAERVQRHSIFSRCCWWQTPRDWPQAGNDRKLEWWRWLQIMCTILYFISHIFLKKKMLREAAAWRIKKRARN